MILSIKCLDLIMFCKILSITKRLKTVFTFFSCHTPNEAGLGAERDGRRSGRCDNGGEVALYGAP